MGVQAELSVDASVLAPPSENCAGADAYQYASALMELGQLIDLSWVSVCRSEETSTILANPSGPYKLTHDNIKRLFDKHNVQEYTPQEVFYVASKILGKSAQFETRHGIRFILLENEKMTPDLTVFASNEIHRSHLPQFVTAIAVLRKNLAHGEKDHIMMIRGATDSNVKVQAQIVEADHDRKNIPEFSNLPKSFSGDVPICGDFTKFVELLDEEKILTDAVNCCGVWLAIRVALHKRTGGTAHIKDWRSWNDIPVTIGDEFLKSCQNLILSGGGTIPRKIIDTVLAIIHGKDRERHAWTKNKGGGAQLTQGKFRAWRSNIDRSRRIHFWKGPHDAIELAAVGDHDTTDFPSLSKLK